MRCGDTQVTHVHIQPSTFLSHPAQCTALVRLQCRSVVVAVALSPVVCSPYALCSDLHLSNILMENWERVLAHPHLFAAVVIDVGNSHVMPDVMDSAVGQEGFRLEKKRVEGGTYVTYLYCTEANSLPCPTHTRCPLPPFALWLLRTGGYQSPEFLSGHGHLVRGLPRRAHPVE